jgi:hypothetical protein
VYRETTRSSGTRSRHKRAGNRTCVAERCGDKPMVVTPTPSIGYNQDFGPGQMDYRSVFDV